MKRLISWAIAAILVIAVAAAVGHRQGWFRRTGAVPAGAGEFPGRPGETASGSPTAGEPGTNPAGQPAALQFDGNVAALAWGGKVESATGVAADDVQAHDDLQDMIDENETTYWRSSGDPGPKEIVVSFAEHESVLTNQVKIVSDDGLAPKDVEVWVSNTSPSEGFTRVATASRPEEIDENAINFEPVEAKYVKLRLLRNYNDQDNQEEFSIREIKVMEAQRRGYTPLLARHPDLLGPQHTPEAGAAVAAAAAPPACKPVTPGATFAAGHGESKRVLVVYSSNARLYGGLHLKKEVDDPGYFQRYPDLEITKRVDFTSVLENHIAPWMLGPKYGYDTVVLDELCADHPTAALLEFQRLLPTWVAGGHKLIFMDADKCSPGPDYGWLPYHLKTDNPGAQGAEGRFLRFTEEDWMAHGHTSRPGFIDIEAWENSTDGYHNELGDSNTLTEWDPHWCGHMVVRNVNNIFGFVHIYAHYGRGLIIYNGFDDDQVGTVGSDLLLSRELAQGFDPDNLPCAARIGNFVVTTDTKLMERPFVPGRSYDYPLTLLSNQGYKGTVNLSLKAFPGLDGMQAIFGPASVALDGLAESKFSLSVPANASSKAEALEVTGVDASGKANSLCLQLVPPTTGELSVVSMLARPPKARKNLEIILDASGSMKLPLGKKTRWTTAHDVLQKVLATLPSDFNVGLRIYGHRESSRSPKTCTDSQLVVPVQQLDQQAILSAAEAVKPRGETPLVYSVLQSITDLKDVGGGTVIVITDGEESCKGDPVKAVAQLKASGLDITLNIVGFTLTGQTVQKQLSSFAQATGGRFYAADNGPALARALQMAAADRFPYSVLDASGKEVAAGEAGGAAEELPAGDYTVVVNAGGTSLRAEHVRVVLAQQTTVRIAAKNDQFVLEY